MSALGHYLEAAGIATVCISLFRPHTERMLPPRTLWVPFELGRPLGEPEDPVFQRQVLSTALQLLEDVRRPRHIADFAPQAPGFADDPDWQPPRLATESTASPDAAGTPEALAADLRALAPAYHRATARRGRTTVGNSGLSLAGIAEFLQAMAAGTPPESPIAGQHPAMAMRLAADDLKAHYLEAAAAEGRPSSRQLQRWFWDTTAAGKLLIRLRSKMMVSDDKLLRMVATGQLVPAEQRERLGL